MRATFVLEDKTSAVLQKKLTTRTRRDGDCLLWTGWLNQHGYGKLRMKKRSHFVHRLSFELATGISPGQMHVLHSCDRPGCVNAAHLFLGTHADNMADMKRKGRAKSGRRSGQPHGICKLTHQLARAIRIDERKQSDIAKDYGVCQQTISNIKTGKIWKVLP